LQIAQKVFHLGRREDLGEFAADPTPLDSCGWIVGNVLPRAQPSEEGCHITEEPIVGCRTGILAERSEQPKYFVAAGASNSVASDVGSQTFRDFGHVRDLGLGYADLSAFRLVFFDDGIPAH